LLPVQRGNVSVSNLQVLNAILHVIANDCGWRGLPEHFGRWHTIYMRMSRWSKNGVLNRVFEQLQMEEIIFTEFDAVSLDSPLQTIAPSNSSMAPLGNGKLL